MVGERNADELARYRDVRCKASVETIRHSLIGHYRAEHVFELTQALALYDIYQTQRSGPGAPCAANVSVTRRKIAVRLVAINLTGPIAEKVSRDLTSTSITLPTSS